MANKGENGQPNKGTTTAIGPTIVIKGKLKSDEDLIVRGRIEAEISSSKALLVEKAFRGQGIARSFFAFIERDRPFQAVAFALEVSPKNTARALYEGMGFQSRHLQMMTRRLAAV